MKCKSCGAILESSICKCCQTDSGVIILSQKEYKDFCNDEKKREKLDRDYLTSYHKLEFPPYELFIDDNLRYVGRWEGKKCGSKLILK